ncbi:MATE family efflux transporter [Methanolobus mangrovi]|uniref:Multidrug export protein MepA n=1 Tax=Methanolobus mangrovi TaxID=3072977 RepID=A0AA51UFG4_9EURY|nr:MATE family efflux transporter [Methanolobus mangrovi]WMW22259.1 MATE family efflux transporter [Methanolobus mangrovi]
MVNEHQLRHDSVWSLFCRFTLPAIAGIVIAGIQTIVDGFFIGNGVGSQGLAAVTLAFPVLMLIVAIGIMAGMGSSSLVALELGKSNRGRAVEVVSSVFSMLLVTGIVIMVLGHVFAESLIRFLGAGDVVGIMVDDYLSVIFAGVIFILFALALEPLVRNDGRPVLAMKVMVVSVLANILLDYIFIMELGMGMMGAAVATVAAFAMMAIMLASYLFSSKAKLKVSLSSMGFDYRTILQIVKTGMPSFAMQFSIAVLLLAHNFVLLKYGSELSVSAFGIIDYSFSMFYMLFEGIAMGVQPIVGFNYGAGLYGRVHRALKIAMAVSFAVGMIGFGIVFLFSELIVSIFNHNDPQLLAVTASAMKIFMVSLLVQGVIVVNATYYQSVNKVWSALFIHLGKIFVFLLPLLFILPVHFGLSGVWFATPISDFLMFLVVMIMIAGELRMLREKKMSKLASKGKSKIITPQY